MPSGTLYVISAPSGAGKTSLVKALFASSPGLRVSVSHTTRAMRPGEVEGRDYFFVTPEVFERLVGEGAFLEHARVFDHRYGTTRQAVEECMHRGEDVILEIDWQGARQIREALPGSVGIFILPPSRAVLRQRLEGRGQDSEAVIDRRMRDAVAELSHHAEYDYLVINDDFDRAVTDLQSILRARRLVSSRQADAEPALLSDLLRD